MIARIYSADNMTLPDGYYGGKIDAYARAYGFGYEFCRFYKYNGGYMLINNSNCIITGRPDKELIEFMSFSGVSSLEAPENRGRIIRGYFFRERNFLSSAGAAYEYNSKELSVNSRLEEVYRIADISFGEIEHDPWYADISHRIRHGISTVFLYKDCAAAVIDFEYKGAGYVSDVAVLPEYRGRGTGKELLCIVKDYLYKKGLECCLFAYNDVLPFYIKNGFKLMGNGSFYLTRDKNQ